MPYISREARDDIADGNRSPATDGELNYQITRAIVEYIGLHGTRYAQINDIVGALELSKATIAKWCDGGDAAKMPLIDLPQTPLDELHFRITGAACCFVKLMSADDDYIDNELTMSVLGAIECAKLEFYRRVAAPYETTKALENGDVY